MGRDRAFHGTARSTRSGAPARHEGDHQRDLLRGENRLPVAGLAQGFSTLWHRLRSFPPPAPAWCLGRNAPGTQQVGAPQKKRRATPSLLLIDSQSVKTNAEGLERGFHGGKKIKGRSRQIAVDTQGLIWAVHIHAANGADTVEGCALGDAAMSCVPGVKAWAGDSAYRGSFECYMQEQWGVKVHITQRLGDGFAVQPQRWIVERTFAWGNGYRRLSKDYEKKPSCSEAILRLSAIRRNLRSLAF